MGMFELSQTMKALRRASLFDKLETFAMQAPETMGFDPSEYPHNAMAELAQALEDARALLRVARRFPDETAPLLETRLYDPYSRLRLLHSAELILTPGQDTAMEYRRAACEILAQTLWDYVQITNTRKQPRETTLSTIQSWLQSAGTSKADAGRILKTWFC